MNNYAANTARIAAIERTGILDCAELETMRYDARTEHLNRSDQNAIDPIALDWWHDSGASAYGHDDDTDYMGDELPSIIELGTCDDDCYECDHVDSEALTEAAECSSTGEGTGLYDQRELVFLLLNYSLMEYGSWKKDSYRATIESKLGYFADSLIATADETVSHYREALYREAKIKSLVSEVDANKSRLSIAPESFGYGKFSELIQDVGSRLSDISESIRAHESLRSHHYDMAQRSLADLMREGAIISEFDA